MISAGKEYTDDETISSNNHNIRIHDPKRCREIYPFRDEHG